MDRRVRVLGMLFTVCGVLMLPWIWFLAGQLHGHATKRSFGASWIGLDVLEVTCLLTVALLMRRRHPATSPVAAAAATVFILDAWFDTMSAAPQLAYAESLAMAFFAELPLAALLLWTATFSLRWQGVRAGS